MVALGFSLEASTRLTYNSATEQYITFCRLHEFPIEPTADTLSLFVTYTSHFIEPASVASYLSGIVSCLESIYPNARDASHDKLVRRALKGCRKQFSSGVNRKRAITREELAEVLQTYHESDDHDDCLFATMTGSGFHGLMRVGELTQPDKEELQDYRKWPLRHTVELTDKEYSFVLPYHKADNIYEGNKVLVHRRSTPDDGHYPFQRYLASRDSRFPFIPELWLRADGTVPTRSWYINRLRKHFPNDDSVSGHSLRPGGATALAEDGVPPHLIQNIGRWKSETFMTYIRTHPVMLAAMCAPTTAPAAPPAP